VRGFLESDRTLNVLLWATIEAMQARPEMLLRAPYLAAVECGGEVVGACSLLPPNPLVIAPHTPREALPLLADDLLACGRAEQVTQVSSPVDVVEAFMALWRERTGRGGAPVMRERLYRIDAAPDVVVRILTDYGSHTKWVHGLSVSQVLDKQPLGHRKDAGALRLRLVATKNLTCESFPDKDDAGAYPPDVILDFDYWAILPRA